MYCFPRPPSGPSPNLHHTQPTLTPAPSPPPTKNGTQTYQHTHTNTDGSAGARKTTVYANFYELRPFYIRRQTYRGMLLFEKCLVVIIGANMIDLNHKIDRVAINTEIHLRTMLL